MLSASKKPEKEDQQCEEYILNGVVRAGHTENLNIWINTPGVVRE